MFQPPLRWWLCVHHVTVLHVRVENRGLHVCREHCVARRSSTCTDAVIVVLAKTSSSFTSSSKPLSTYRALWGFSTPLAAENLAVGFVLEHLGVERL